MAILILIKRSLRVFLLFCLCAAPVLWGLVPLGAGLKALLTALLGVHYLAVHLVPWRDKGVPRRLQIMMGGYELFLSSAWLSLVMPFFFIVYIRRTLQAGPLPLPAVVGSAVLTLFLLFLLVSNGFFRVLFTSARLRLVMRVLLICLWWCPVVNLILLWRACSLVKSEYRFDTAKQALNDMRKENEVCRTKYPLVLVHGIFFRDWQLVNYWGRIPKELIRNGAVIYYGGQQSSAAVADSAAELKEQLMNILAETGSEKVNIIAHSKGGLDSRYAITHLGLDRYVASLTTINTPHRGCVFAQSLMDLMPGPLVRWVGSRYNAIFRGLGDENPDFIAGVTDLRADKCAVFNQTTPDREGVLYQSVMSTMKKSSSAGFPLNFSYLLVKKYDREENDGLVSLSSAKWGHFLGNESLPSKRGISHGDIIDLMREDIPGFDVREFYIRLVRDLKERGL